MMCPIFFVGYQLRTDLIKFSQMLTQLQNQSAFQLRDFENKIEHIRNVIAKVKCGFYMWVIQHVLV